MSAHTKGKIQPEQHGWDQLWLVTEKAEGRHAVAQVMVKTAGEGYANAARLALCWNTHDQLLEALEEAVASGMVPVSSAADGGAVAYSRVVRAADQIRAAIKAAKGEA